MHREGEWAESLAKSGDSSKLAASFESRHLALVTS